MEPVTSSTDAQRKAGFSGCLKHQENCGDCVRASCTYIQRRDDSWECVEEISGGVMDLIDPGTPPLQPYYTYSSTITSSRRTVEFDEYVDDDEEFYADAFDYPLPFPHVDNVAPSRQGTPAPYSRQGTPVPHSRQATPFPPSRYGTPAPPTRDATPLREATPFREGASTREPSPFVQEPPVTPIPMRAPPTPQEILQQMERQIVSSPQPEELRERRPARIRRQFHDLVITTTKTKTYRKN
ncbi:Translation initiation factor IF-2 [Orchesella cincta]|uniref:Translation initiation factor IF-2 n=1 Tax=Orchesella cincta TaxID=48709 RepID=A0A1D2MGI0_ORCCI|nr:Translation initiation factor IF-2 [Orchesella cincta]